MIKNANILLCLYLFSYLMLNLLDYLPIDTKGNLIADIYYIVDSFWAVGIFYLFYLIVKNKAALIGNKVFSKLIIVILTYKSWALIVNVLISVGVGSPKTPIYSYVDIGIIMLGMIIVGLWSYVLKR